MSKTSKKVPPAKGQSSLFSFFTKKTAPAPPEPEPEPQPEAREAPSAPLRAPAPPAVEKKPAYVVMEDDKSLYVGRAVRVFWPNEKQWFSGVVESYSADENTHSVLYEDGDQEDLCLDREKFEFIDTESSNKKRRNAENESTGTVDAATKKVKTDALPSKKNQKKRISVDSDSEEEFNLESSGESSSEDDDVYESESESLSDSESDANSEDIGHGKKKKTANKRLQKGNKETNIKRKKVCADDNSTAASVSRPPKPSSLQTASSLPLAYSQYSAHSASPSSSSSSSPSYTPTAHSTPSLGGHSIPLQITPSPRHGGGGGGSAARLDRVSTTTTPTTSSPPVEVNRIPLPEGVTGLGSHDHNSWSWLKPATRKDKDGRKMDHPDYNPRTIYIPPATIKDQTPAMRQWFEIKQDYFDTVLFFKVGKFYELFHMDADIGMSELDLIYMKGTKAHSGFPEVSYGKYASQLVAKGYRVARVEQTETPEMLKERNARLKQQKQVSAKVVARELCSIMSKGTRTFCHLDDMSILDASSSGSSNSLLLCVKEMPVETVSADTGTGDSLVTTDGVVEYGLCLVDPVLCTITLAQFQDDQLRNRLRTVLALHKPTEVLLERGAHSRESEGVLQLLAPEASVVVLRSEEMPAAGEDTVALLREGDYFKDKAYPPVLQASIEGLSDGSSRLVMAALGGCVRFLQRSLIDYEVLSHGRCYAYVPPDLPEQHLSQSTSEATAGEAPAAAWVDVGGNLDALPDRGSSSSGRKNMVLDAITMANLEILVNTFDHTEKGSLWAFMNHCRTPFGCRLLKEWVCKPLFDVRDIARRSQAVDELMVTFSAEADQVRGLLKGCPDVERLLSRVHANGLKKLSDGRDHPEVRAIMYENPKYNSRKIRDFMDLLAGFDILVKVCDAMGPAVMATAESPLLRMAIAPTSSTSGRGQGKFPLEEIKSLLIFFRDLFDEKQAKRDGFIRPKPGKDVDYDEAKADVAELEKCFEEYLKEQKRALGISELAYFGTNKDRYQLEVPIKKTSQVPKNWSSKSQKKTHRRYWTPYIEETLARLVESEDRLKEAQMDTMRRVFEKFDQSIALWSTAISCISLVDALLALASVSSAPGYTWATFVPPSCSEDALAVMDIRGARHAMLEKVMESRGDGSFIANDVLLGGRSAVTSGLTQDDEVDAAGAMEYGARMMLVSGPNMGGKSTLLRQTCLIAIMAQIGCKVPAEKVVLTPVDRIFTRIGASDKILSGQSTFFVELAETAMILKYATKQSLCILDELGRGTSTFDGTAIAHAVVEHLVARVKCISLFATHYHSLVNDWSLDPRVKLGHMDCFVQTEEEGQEGVEDNLPPAPPGEEVTFLYKLCAGSSPRSYGINVARLARLPQEILDTAQLQSAVFEDQLSKKRPQLSDEASVDENLDKKALYVKVYDRIISIAESDISAAEMTWLVREIWQRFQHVVSSAK